MKTRTWTRSIAGALTAMAFVVPGKAQAVPVLSKIAQCYGVAEVGPGTTTCTSTFMLNDSRVPTEIESHANFHVLSASGSITMEWRDANQNTVATFVCNAPGLYLIVDLPGGFTAQGGPADLSTFPNCTSQVNGAEFATGEQTLIVTARARSCIANNGNRTRCLFHGYLTLNRSTLL